MYGQFAQMLVKTAREYKGAALNVVIVLGTWALKIVVDNEGFRCPCVAPDNLDQCKSSSEYYEAEIKCTKNVNVFYGLSHTMFPAIALYFIGMLATPRLWKVITGLLTATPRIAQQKRGLLLVLSTIHVRACMAPFVWVVLILLDGKHIACAMTPLPYDVGEDRLYKTCADVASAKEIFHSDVFETNKIISQIIGWNCFAFLLCVGFVGRVYVACTSPMTYYHSKYYEIYRENEAYEINDEMKIKAQADAEANVRKFMSDRRGKEEWDEISQVYDYHRDSNNLSIWSSLHRWTLENSPKKNESKSM